MTRARAGRGIALTLAAFGLGAVLQAAEIIRVTPITRDGRILVSFEMRDGFTAEIRAAISSGLTTTFRYDVELRRGAPVWFDKTVAAATVAASVKFDNLTRIYQVSRTQDGRVEDTRMIHDPDIVQKWMTQFEKLSLFSTTPLERNAEYYVRIRARTRPRNAWFVWPWDREAASAIAKFTFIP